jgi:PAS domain S-box-containing protein
MTLAPHLDTDRLADLFEGSPMSVLVTLPAIAGRDQRIVYVNAAFERMTGWSRKAITGLTPAVLQGPDTDLRIFNDLKARLARGDAWRGEAVNYRRDGRPFRMAWSISAVRGPAGEVAAFLAIREDVTDRRRAERALRESKGATVRSSSSPSSWSVCCRPTAPYSKSTKPPCGSARSRVAR